VAGQVLTIDVDTDGLSSSLDSVLELFDSNGNWLDTSYDDPAPGEKDSIVDPYLVFTVPADGGGIYKFGISADGTGVDGTGVDTGPYTFFLECSGQSTTSEFKWSDEVGYLIGSTGSDTGSLINIIPEDAIRSFPFDLGVGRIADIEFDPSTNKLFVAINESPGSIITFDQATGDQDQTFSLTSVTEMVPTVAALEAAENKLYGVQVNFSSGEEVNWTLVTVDITPGTATLSDVVSFDSPVRSLAYHPSERILYGASGTDLIKIDPASTPVGIVPITLTGLSVQIVSLDFSHEDVLYGVDGSGNLFKVPDLSTSPASVEIIGPIDVSAWPEGVSGLTFVVGEFPEVDPIKTICSATLTTSAFASSGTADPKLSKFKPKRNPLRRAIGLFRFEGIEGETITLNATLEGAESAEAVVEESSASELENSWLNHWKGKGRVFLGIRDSIPDLDFRVRKKDHLPLTMSATLPANGTYYIMLIRPLLRFYQTDYCLTLESDYEESQAWETFDVAWPHDESDDDTASTSAEEPKDVQNNTETLDGGSANDGPVPVTLSTTAVAPTSAAPEENTVEETGDVSSQVLSAVNLRDPEPADEDDSKGAINDDGATTVEEPVEVVTPEESVADGGGDTEVVQSDGGGETTIVEPVAETPVVQEPTGDTGTVETQPAEDALSGGETTDEPTAAGDTTVEELVEEVTPEEPVAEGGGDTEVVLTDGGGDISEADDKEPTEASTP
jgi:hypothetical protein